jgi:hypothetical protein
MLKERQTRAARQKARGRENNLGESVANLVLVIIELFVKGLRILQQS